jgi:uncharacterized membrane protein
LVRGLTISGIPRRMVGLMPTRYGHPHSLVLISGAAEILGGIGLLVQRTRRMAAWGLMAVLVIYFEMHISMLMHAERFPSIPLWLLYARIPQSVCVYCLGVGVHAKLPMRNPKAPASTRRPLFESYSLLCRVAEWLEERRAITAFIFCSAEGGTVHGAAHFFKKLFETARQTDQSSLVVLPMQCFSKGRPCGEVPGQRSNVKYQATAEYSAPPRDNNSCVDPRAADLARQAFI